VTSHLRSAADLLWDCWQAGRRLQSVPEALRPRTRSEGYAIQALLEERSSAPLFGWKIAATSAAGQAHINVTGPLAGRLLHERVVDLSRPVAAAADLSRRSPEEAKAELPFGANYMRVAEAEFAFRMARDLPPRTERYSVDEVLAVVATLHPAIEVPDSRFDDFTMVGDAQLIADNACAHLFVLGAAAQTDWRALDLVEYPVTGTVVGQPLAGRENGRLTRDGKGDNVLGDPRVALAWLANELSALGITLRAGEVVTTGTCLTPLPIEPGDDVVADFGGLGRVSVHITR
jgi:2-keto-4-pentenoate hydratase